MLNPIKAAIDAQTVSQLVEIFPPEEDEAALWDAIRLATNFHEALEALAGQYAADRAMVHAIALQEDDLAVRKKRYGARCDKWREIIMKLMTVAGLRKAELPVATLSIAARAPSLQIIDETMIDDRFTRTKREIDKRALSDALKAGEVVPGACLSNGGESLTIRSK